MHRSFTTVGVPRAAHPIRPRSALHSTALLCSPSSLGVCATRPSPPSCPRSAEATHGCTSAPRRRTAPESPSPTRRAPHPILNALRMRSPHEATPRAYDAHALRTPHRAPARGHQAGARASPGAAAQQRSPDFWCAGRRPCMTSAPSLELAGAEDRPNHQVPFPARRLCPSLDHPQPSSTTCTGGESLGDELGSKQIGRAHV